MTTFRAVVWAARPKVRQAPMTLSTGTGGYANLPGGLAPRGQFAQHRRPGGADQAGGAGPGHS